MWEILLMRLGFFKECMVSLIFLGINLLSLSITFFWSQLKLWSASQQCLAISFLSQSQFLTDLLCSSECDFKDRLDSPKLTARQLLQSISLTILFLSSVAIYLLSIFWFTKESRQSLFSVESRSHFMRSEYTP